MAGKKYKRKRDYAGVGRRVDIAVKALKIAQGVKKLLNVEYHSVITDLVADPNSTGTVTGLTSVAQGDDFTQRQGRKIKAVSMKIKGNIALHGSATDSVYRLLIVRDNNGSTTQPSIGLLFTDVATFLNNKNKLGDPQTNSRFTILSDTWYTMHTNDVEQIKIDIYLKLTHHIYFSGTGATDEGKGHIYAFQASNEATNDPVVNCDVMFKWIDN